jgi:predicted kinase
MTHKFIISPSLVVDNTNLDLQSVKPYVDAAISHGYKVELVEPDTEWRYDIGECFKHNTHKVPRDTITKMLNKLNNNRDAIASYIKEANSKIKE